MMNKLKLFQHRFCIEEQGAVPVEYALLAMLIALAIVVAVGVLGLQLCGVFANIRAMFGGAASNGNASC